MSNLDCTQNIYLGQMAICWKDKINLRIRPGIIEMMKAAQFYIFKFHEKGETPLRISLPRWPSLCLSEVVVSDKVKLHNSISQHLTLYLTWRV